MKDPDFLRRWVQCLSQLGAQRFNDADYAGAAENFSAALFAAFPRDPLKPRADPASRQLQCNVARSCCLAGDTETGVALAERLFARFPDDTEVESVVALAREKHAGDVVPKTASHGAMRPPSRLPRNLTFRRLQRARQLGKNIANH